MSYCLNPDCVEPQNPLPAKFCQCCGSLLLLKERYRALLPIGEGGFGRTYVAVDEHRLQTRCVIKQFVPQTLGSNTLRQASLDRAIRLFNQEAMRLDELGEHPQIPTLLAYFEQEKRLYLVQQFIEGYNLFQELHLRGPFNEPEIRSLLADLLPVLTFIHERNVIHRDIKPANIIRSKGSKQLVLIDFGVAKQLSTSPLTKAVGTKIGTEGYAPIEQWRGGKAYPASDLYSLGATCVHLLTRVKPDSLFDPMAGRWIWRDHLASMGVKISDRLEQILDKLLKDAVVERYQSASEVLRELDAIDGLPPAPPRPLAAPVPPLPDYNGPPSGQFWQNYQTLVGHTDRIRAIAISPDGKRLASASSDKTIRLWDLETSTFLHSLTDHIGAVHAVLIHPNRQILLSGSSDKTIRLWHLEKGKLLHTFVDHINWVNALALETRGQLLVSGSDDRTVRIWDLKTGTLMQTLTGHTGPVHAVAISPDGQVLASGSGDRTVRLWQLESGQSLATPIRHASRINSVVISPNGQILVSGGDDSTIKVWNLKTNQMMHILTAHSDAVSSLAISADSRSLISGSHDTTVKVWELASGKLIHTLNGHSWWVNAVAISPNGQIIASGSADKVIKLWRISR
ncbi:hypothetical protein BST81_01885 [Leptolyngbya sp. 'hensonii']|uniref:serine/threonine-protein kinase n=1 Tax=Leptolyngbya sp. 'hensonii' TaxID=1922337 RepID=UPI00094F9AF0|nr:serine/threonine-protein kinase [Leptolyngbya sp. 'hensonii']OLP20206.1 hypothetical protein BST81_01885 [Leptolyngbya sp. 'hensonii']